MKEMMAKVSGADIEEVPGYDYSKTDLPVFFPTVGMTDEEVDTLYVNSA